MWKSVLRLASVLSLAPVAGPAYAGAENPIWSSDGRVIVSAKFDASVEMAGGDPYERLAEELRIMANSACKMMRYPSVGSKPTMLANSILLGIFECLGRDSTLDRITYQAWVADGEQGYAYVGDLDYVPVQ